MPNKFLGIHRIRRPAEFKHVYAERQRVFGLYYVAYCRHNPQSIPRLGVVASKRNLRLAVSRNRAKRAAREVFRKQKGALSGWDMVIAARKEAGEATQEELTTCLKNLMARIARRQPS